MLQMSLCFSGHGGLQLLPLPSTNPSSPHHLQQPFPPANNGMEHSRPPTQQDRQQKIEEKALKPQGLWRQFFTDPTQWCDYTLHKGLSNEGLRAVVWQEPSWIEQSSNSMNADQAFHLSKRSVFEWSAMISAHTKLGESEQAIKLYHQMQNLSFRPDGHIFVAVLKACSSIFAIEQGTLVHYHIVESGLELDAFVSSTLIDMYAKCGKLDDAHMVFNRVPKHNVVAWSALITGYAQQRTDKALAIFDQMLQEGLQPDRVTFLCILKACSSIAASKEGKCIHAHIIESGFEWHTAIGNTLIDMYGKCGNLHDACRLFYRLPEHSVVTWSALTSGYAQHGYGQEALQLFKQMEKEGLDPNPVTFVCVLKACSSITALIEGREIHSHIIRTGFESHIFVGNTLIDMYGKCGSVKDAHAVFDELPEQDIVTWNALIAGYAQNELGYQALVFFEQLQQLGFEPNTVTFVCILKACSGIAALEQGRLIHAHIVESMAELNVILSNTLIDMYAKCGSFEEAQMAFFRMPKQDVVTWNTIIAGCAQHSNYTSALQYFNDMQQSGLKPDEVTFVCLLLACCHVGLVDEGCLHFKRMQEDHGITPRLEHYDSIVDLLSHAGHFKEAEDLLETIPFPANVVGWTTLLTSCRTHSNVDLGKRCFDQIVTMDYGNAPGYVLMSNIYTYAGMQEDAKRIEDLRICVNRWKKPAKAFIEIDNHVHQFIVGDEMHPRINDIHAKLRTLNIQMRDEGYKPRLDLALNLNSVEDKEDALCGHCEKLAIAFGLLCTHGGTTIRVSKNLRMCADCHNATKLISKIESREIIVISAYRIHHFQDGECSCNDYC